MTAPLKRPTTIPTARRVPFRLALEDAVAVRHRELALGVLRCDGGRCLLLLDFLLDHILDRVDVVDGVLDVVVDRRIGVHRGILVLRRLG